MPTNEVKPTNAPGRPRKGTMTWVGLGLMLVFVIMLVAVIVRPIIARHDGPEDGVPAVDRPAVAQSNQ